MNNRLKELTKNTFIITLGRISTQFISFLLLPLYTALLSSEEYGTVDLITTIVQLLVPIISLMIDQGTFRYLLSSKDEEKQNVISSAFFATSIFNLFFLVMYGIFTFHINVHYKFWIIIILIITCYCNLFLQIARGLKRTIEYAIGSFICSATIIIFNVLFIAVIKIGAVGMLLATFLGNFICVIYLFFKLDLSRYISINKIEKECCVNELKYSLPLIPNQLSVWVMNSSDRLIITYVLGTAANGILAVSHKFPAIFMTFFNIFLLAWHETGAIHFYDNDREKFFSDAIEKIIIVFTAIGLIIILFLPIVFKWFVNESYDEAYYNIPIYMIASLFNVVVGVLGVVYVATKKTIEIAKTTIISAIINIVVNILLINRIGLFAASISTLVSYFITMIYRIYDTKKYITIKYNINKMFLCLLTTFAGCFVYYLRNIIISLIAIPLFLIIFMIFNKKEIFVIKDIINQKIKGVKKS